MFRLDFSHTIDRLVSVLTVLKTKHLAEARRSALSSVGFFLSQEVRKWIESAGAGSWAQAHPLTRLLERRGGRWEKRRGFISPYHGLGKFARYLLNGRKTEIRIGFGAFKASDIKKGKQLAFLADLQDLAANAQTSRSFTVSAKMRGLMGATRRKPGDQPGQEFFPLKLATSKLQAAARPIMKPVFAKASGAARLLFVEKFSKKINKLFEGEK